MRFIATKKSQKEINKFIVKKNNFQCTKDYLNMHRKSIPRYENCPYNSCV